MKLAMIGMLIADSQGYIVLQAISVCTAENVDSLLTILKDKNPFCTFKVEYFTETGEKVNSV